MDYCTNAYPQSETDVANGGATRRAMFQNIHYRPIEQNPSKFPRFISENDVPDRYNNWRSDRYRIADNKQAHSILLHNDESKHAQIKYNGTEQHVSSNLQELNSTKKEANRPPVL